LHDGAAGSAILRSGAITLRLLLRKGPITVGLLLLLDRAITLKRARARNPYRLIPTRGLIEQPPVPYCVLQTLDDLLVNNKKWISERCSE